MARSRPDDARPWISSSAVGCWKRSAPMARSWPGDAMRKLDPWHFALPCRASKRSGSRMLWWALLRRQALARLPIGPKSKAAPSLSAPPSVRRALLPDVGDALLSLRLGCGRRLRGKLQHGCLLTLDELGQQDGLPIRKF